VIKALPATPDIIVMLETVNRRVLEDLVDRHLPGYEIVQLDTSDKPVSRGIDVGLLTRLPLTEAPTAHPVLFGGDDEVCGKTRDILLAPLRLPDGETLHVFGVHFPCGGNPIQCLIRAFRVLNELAEGLSWWRRKISTSTATRRSRTPSRGSFSGETGMRHHSSVMTALHLYGLSEGR
jgi:hypothetical protein